MALSVTGIFDSMLGILTGFVPIGVTPIYFWLTLVISLGIIFLLMQNLPFFKDSRGIAFIVSAIIAYFVASSAFATIIIAKLFPSIGLAIMAILGLLMVIALLSPKSFEGEEGFMPYAPIIVIIVFLVIIWMTYSAAAPELSAAGFISKSTGIAISDSDMALVIVAIAVIGGLWLVFKPKSRTGSEGLKKFWEVISRSNL